MRGLIAFGASFDRQMLVLFFSLVAKWARRSETAFYFSGASIRKSLLVWVAAKL